MKTFSQDLKNSYDTRVTTITNCIKIQRLDGTTYTFTSLDKDLVIDNEIYKSSYAFNPTAYSSALGLQIENMEIEGAVDFLNIYDFDIIKNLFYGALVWVFSVDYKNLAAGKNKILFGTVGEIELTDDTFKMEIRGMSKRYDTLYANYYGKICRARLGDSKCGIDLSSYTLYGAVNQITNSATILGSHLLLTLTTTIAQEVQVKNIKFFDRVGNEITPIGITQTGTDDLKCSDNISRPLSNLIDGDSTTFVCLNTTNYTTTSLVVDFGQAVSVGYIAIEDNYSYNNNNISKVDISRSINGYTWYTVINIITSAYRNNNLVYIPLGIILAQDTASRYKFLSNDVAASGNVSNYYQYGNITWLTGANTGLQTEIIYSSTGGNIELALPMPYDIQDGDTFKMTPGCNHLLITKDDVIASSSISVSTTSSGSQPPSMQFTRVYNTTASGHCKVKFNNVINFRGEPYLPNEDVLLSGFVAEKSSEENPQNNNAIVLNPVP
jgi:hypothetical protein